MPWSCSSPRPRGGADGYTDSSGTTNSEGLYVLNTPLAGAGGLVGKHKVMIRSTPANVTAYDPTRDDNFLLDAKKPKERSPRGTTPQTTLMFEVPAKGTTSANFAITSK